MQETISSIFYMLRQRLADMDYKNEVRARVAKSEKETAEAKDQSSKLKQRIEQLQSELKES